MSRVGTEMVKGFRDTPKSFFGFVVLMVLFLLVVLGSVLCAQVPKAGGDLGVVPVEVPLALGVRVEPVAAVVPLSVSVTTATTPKALAAEVAQTAPTTTLEATAQPLVVTDDLKANLPVATADMLEVGRLEIADVAAWIEPLEWLESIPADAPQPWEKAGQSGVDVARRELRHRVHTDGCTPELLEKARYLMGRAGMK